jgi:hypothetical protein
MKWQKEYWLIAVVVLCAVLWYYRQELGKEANQPYLTLIPAFGGALFGVNTLINLVK